VVGWGVVSAGGRVRAAFRPTTLSLDEQPFPLTKYLSLLIEIACGGLLDLDCIQLRLSKHRGIEFGPLISTLDAHPATLWMVNIRVQLVAYAE
jgi:hypothetical protein